MPVANNRRHCRQLYQPTKLRFSINLHVIGGQTDTEPAPLSTVFTPGPDIPRLRTPAPDNNDRGRLAPGWHYRGYD